MLLAATNKNFLCQPYSSSQFLWLWSRPWQPWPNNQLITGHAIYPASLLLSLIINMIDDQLSSELTWLSNICSLIPSLCWWMLSWTTPRYWEWGQLRPDREQLQLTCWLEFILKQEWETQEGNISSESETLHSSTKWFIIIWLWTLNNIAFLFCLVVMTLLTCSGTALRTDYI